VKNNHLTYFKIENFKKFDSLEVNDIGQFNLIVGDNNVGKTCLLEALLFDENPQQLLNNFYLGLTKRGLKFEIEEITRKSNNLSITETTYPKGNYFEEFIMGSFPFEYVKQTVINYKDSKENIIKISKIKESFKEKILLNNFINKAIKKEDILNQFVDISKSKDFKDLESDGEYIWIYNYNLNILNFPLISFNDTPLEEETRGIYENLKTKREKQILIDVLKVVNPKIVDIELRENFEDLKSVFLISFEDKDEFVPLNFLGDGFKRIFYIVLKALSLKGKRILIDEIEIGIHYSKMKYFWINIMKVCKELDVQLFATTHSQECIESYLEASKETNEKDIRLIRLQENKDKSIKAICYKEEYIEYMVESNTEER
jgi:AAA15 family ATPase/GTPase